MEFVASQLAAAGGEASGEDATPPAAGADAAQFASSQQVAGTAQHVSGPRVELVCRSNPKGVADALQHCAMAAKHREKLHLGRRGGAARVATGQRFAELTSVVASGVSRNHAWLEFDSSKGVTLTSVQGAGCPTFVNGAPLGRATRLLVDGDLVGFGGGEAAEEDSNTFVYRVRLVDVPEPKPMPPPPPRLPVPMAGGRRAAPDDASEPEVEGSEPQLEEASPGDSARRRSRGCKRHKSQASAQVQEQGGASSSAAEGAAGASSAAAVPGTSVLHATAEVQRAHAGAVRGLQGSEQRRWAQKFLSVASEIYGIAQQVVAEAEATANGDPGPIHSGIARAHHKLEAFHSDSQAALRREHNAARAQQGRNGRRDRAHGRRGRDARHASRGRGRGA